MAGGSPADWQKGEQKLLALKPNFKAFYTNDANSQQLIATGETPVMPRTAAHLAGKPERFDRLPADAETIKAYVRAFAEG